MARGRSCVGSGPGAGAERQQPCPRRHRTVAAPLKSLNGADSRGHAALSVLRENPLAEGDMYEGDLLSAVLTRNPVVWTEFPGIGRELRAIVSELIDLPAGLQQKVERFLIQQR
ncbi:contact-dependent growth inhibition system immunity protein [Streptomyces sp. NPDC094468]|uniref:contact-dependent growth inhibition system immunity protein n=1 Tax=Streptomyces sp. NPDC094468 TaxID=3366066 RepID=UPI00382CEBC7